MHEAPPNTSFWSELKRRHVVKVAVAYLIVGFGVGEAADIFLPALNLPAWTVTFVVALVVLGFPLALVLAWAFDITPEGIVRDGASVGTPEAETGSGGGAGGGGSAGAETKGEAGVTPSGTVEAPPARDDMPSIAVLPFADMSPDGDQEYFGDGMAEELLNALTRLDGLRVAARTSSFACKGKNLHIRDIGKDLEVATILEGSVRKAGTRLRITAQLIQVDGGHHLWSEVYEREMEDVFAIQDEITRAVVDALRVELLGEPEVPLVTAVTDNHEAYDLYLKGRHYWSRRYQYGLQTAIQFFEEAVAKAPDFALPFTGIVDTNAVLSLYAFIPPREARDKAVAALEKATALGPELPEVAYSQALVGLIGESSVDEAARILSRVVSMDPRHGVARGWHCMALIAQGRWGPALAEGREAAEREPHSGYVQGLVALAFSWTKDAVDGIPFGERALKLEPDGVLGLYSTSFLYSAVGRHDEAIKLMGRVVDKTERHPLFLGLLARVLSAAERTGEAEFVLEELLGRYDPARPIGVAAAVGAAYAALGNGDDATTWMNKGIAEGFPLRLHMMFPSYDLIRGHPEFARIVDEVGLPALWADPTLDGRRGRTSAVSA